MSDHIQHESTYPANGTALKANCEQCFSLCCVSLPFSASSDFAIDKGAAQPCPHLQANFRCSIHSQLRQQGFRGCTVYDCFGAGQHVSQHTFNGMDWRQSPGSASMMYEVFPIVRQLHELLWYLHEALRYELAQSLRDALQTVLDDIERLTQGTPAELLALDVPAVRERANQLLLQTSQLVRSEAIRSLRIPQRSRTYDERGADLMGAKLRNADLRAANLRGAYLIAADLRGADLRAADLIGADFRDADIRDADLSTSLFLTQMQLHAARGNDLTKLPPFLNSPWHWDS